ncbi:uncharacterized protein METZ01_LOCUS37681 [marine metagenome]|uniref:Uncharacterized protein n=1 Tax=marine metagenome TaxID=408172 RepID=A0A381R4R8_9ZZZZ
MATVIEILVIIKDLYMSSSAVVTVSKQFNNISYYIPK